MRLLLDTHALLWWLADDPALDREARAAIGASGNAVLVNAASAWEIAIKQALGRLEAPEDLLDALAASRLEPIAITVQHALAAGALPHHHDDPFDRMLVAQAMIEQLTLVTRDERLEAYGVTTMRA